MDEDLVVRLVAAFNDRDIDALRSLLAEGAIWGDDPHSESFCRERTEIIRRVEQLLTAGVRPTIVEATAGPRGIAARVEVRWPKAEDARRDRNSYAQAYVVEGGLVTEIHGFDDFASAVAAISQ